MNFFAILITIILIGFDQLTKYFAFTKLRLMDTQSIHVIEGVLNFSYVQNEGAAFGLMQGAIPFFVVFTIIILIMIVYYFIKIPKTKIYNWVRFALVLISAGAIGNLIDRVKNGFVIDFLHATLIKFMSFPVFNLADIYVVVGTFLLAILLLFFIKDDEDKVKKVGKL